MDEPTGHTIDGTPWEEPRPPHLPDPMTGVARRVPIAAWGFIALAIGFAAWGLRDLGSYLVEGAPRNVLDLAAGATQPVAVCLFGAALFIRHPRAWQTDPRVVFGIVLLVVVEVMQVATTQFDDLLTTIFPVDDGTLPFFAPGRVFISLLTGAASVLGLLYLARGLVDARERDDDGGVRRRAVLIWVVAVMAMIAVAGTWYVPWSRGQLDLTGGWAAIYDVGFLLIGLATVAATVYLTATASTGFASGERPRRAWRFAAIGLWLILLGSLVSSSVFFVGNLITVDQEASDRMLSILRITGFVLAAGYLFVLAGFIRGLPGVDDVADEVVADEGDEVVADEAGVADEVVADEAGVADEAAGDIGSSAEGGLSPSHEATFVREPEPPEAPRAGV